MKPLLSKSLLQGGLIVGLSQVFPILHLVAGLLGMMISTKIFPRPPTVQGIERFDKEIQGVYCGALTTLITGGLLMAIALVIGLLIREFARRRERRNSARIYYK
jgi:hypothetical protein